MLSSGPASRWGPADGCDWESTFGFWGNSARQSTPEGLFQPALGLNWLCRTCLAVQGYKLALLLVVLMKPWLRFSLQLILLCNACLLQPCLMQLALPLVALSIGGSSRRLQS